MTVCKDILTKLMAEPITKIIGEPGQGDTSTLGSKLVEKAAKIKITDDMVEKGQKYGFLVIVLGTAKDGSVGHPQRTLEVMMKQSNQRISHLTAAKARKSIPKM